MANTKDYAMREMILDRCFSTGKEYTREELMAIVNKELEQRGHWGQVSVSLKDIVYYFKRFLPLFPSNTCICWIAIWLSFTKGMTGTSP